jgi:N-acetylneuraminate lyase
VHELRYPRLTGLIAAPFTAFHGDGSLNPALVEKQMASLLRSGVTGAFVCGTTGEGASLTTAERMLVAEQWKNVAGEKLPVIVHVGHTSIGDCRGLAAHAQKIRASGIGCVAPFYFKPSKVEDLVDFCAEVAAAAPDLPFYYYHIPSMTGVSLAAADFLRVAATRIPNLAGVKFTCENLEDYAESVRFKEGRYDILFGRDEMLLDALSVGARGAIGTTYNFAAPLYRQIIAAFEKGDLAGAQKDQARANTMIAIFLRFGGLSAAKAIMRIIGIDCGPVRLPLRPLANEAQAQLHAELKRIGFFEFSSQS